MYGGVEYCIIKYILTIPLCIIVWSWLTIEVTCWGIIKNDVNPYLKASCEGNNAVGRNKTRGGRLGLFLATIMVFALQHTGCLRESCS